jgi:hypothetical protein
MPRQESTTDVKAWVDEETRHIDVVASWESLCDTYDSLRFADPLSDSERLEEYKWIVQQMNSFLSKMRTKLLSCRDKEAMVEMLSMSFNPTGKMELSARRALVYQKLRQQWVKTEIMRLQAMMDQEQETKEEQDGWQY